jgi:CyaY protein
VRTSKVQSTLNTTTGLTRHEKTVVMNDVEFQDRVEKMFLVIEDRIDELELDIDIDSSGGILTMTCENGSSVILSRQIATHEIWVAAKSGGFHLKFDGADWNCGATHETLGILINRVFSEQLDDEITLL